MTRCVIRLPTGGDIPIDNAAYGPFEMGKTPYGYVEIVGQNSHIFSSNRLASNSVAPAPSPIPSSQKPSRLFIPTSSSRTGRQLQDETDSPSVVPSVAPSAGYCSLGLFGYGDGKQVCCALFEAVVPTTDPEEVR